MTAEPRGTHRARAEHLGPELRRPLVLDAALQVWLEHGYPGTTMALIAQTAQVSKPVLYACYADKDEVLRALMQREEHRLIGAAQDALPETVDVTDVGEVMRSAYAAFFRATLDHPASWRVVFDSQYVNDPVIAAKVAEGRSTIVAQLAALITANAHPDDPRLPERTARLYAQNLVALAESNAAMLLRGDDDGWAPDELAAAVTTLVLQPWSPSTTRAP